MISLFKQAFKSLKHSILELMGLVFIFFIVVFTVFSTLFMFFNIDYSLTDLQTKSNASNVVVEKKYSTSNPVYNYQDSLNIAPISKSVFVSNYVYNASLPSVDATGFANNLIFPYDTLDFTNADPTFGVNSVDTTSVAPYDDRYLSRYINRKKGVLRANSNNLGLIQNININNPNSWRGIGWQMYNPDSRQKVFDPLNLIFDSYANKPKIAGYFNNGIINFETVMYYGLYQPKNNNINPLLTNGMVKQPSINTIVSQPIVIDWKIDSNLLENVAFYKDLFSALTTNVSSVNIPHYNIFLDKSSLFGIDKYIYERIINIVDPIINPDINDSNNPNYFYKDFLLSLISKDVPIRDEWITSIINEPNSQVTTRQEALELFLKNNALDSAKTFSKFVENYRDEFILDYLNNKYVSQIAENEIVVENATIGENKSFSFFDREANKNYLISSKDNAIKDKLVVSSGIAPQSSDKFDAYVDIINKFSLTDVYSTNYDFYNLIYEFCKLIIKLEKPIISNNANELHPERALDNYLEIEYDHNAPKFSVNTVLSIAKELIIQYESKEFSKKGYDHRLVNKLFSYLSSPTITTDEFRKLSINFDYMKGIYANSLANSLKLSSIFHQNYQAVVSEKFIEKSDKKILPLTNVGNPIHSWSYALSLLSAKEFELWLSNLPEEYKIIINSLPFILTGIGISADMAYPLTSLENPIIHPTNDILIYVNNAGYSAIKAKLPFTHENRYFSFIVKDKTLINSFVNELNNELSAIMNGSTSTLAFKVNANLLYNPLVSLRYSFPKVIQFYIQIFSMVVAIILLIIGIYLSFTIVKSWINKNKIQLGIIKANGFSTSKITMCMIFLPLIISIVGGGLGYLAAILLQQPLFSIVSSYIFLSVNFFTFNFIFLAAIIVIIFSLTTLFIFINLKLLFKKPISGIINQTIETKNNSFIKLLNKAQVGFNSNIKLKNQLLFLNIPRTLFYVISSTMCVFLIGAFSSFSQKLHLSQSLTNANKQYNYSIDLATPTEQGGLYKTQKYSELGFENPAIGIYDMYQPHNGYFDKFPYNKSDLKVLEKVINPINGNITWEHKKREDGSLLYFSNLVLPSQLFLNRINSFYDTFRNIVFSKWLINLEIKSGFNLWEIIKNNLNPEIIAKVESQDKIFLDLIANDIDLGTEFRSFALQNPTNGKWALDANKVLDLRPDIKFKDTFIIFIGKVYGKEHLSSADIKISYGTVPYFDNSSVEYYTYVDANIKNPNINSDYKIYGIQSNSTFMPLQDNHNKPIGHLLDSNENNIIINNGAAYKYGLKVGDKLTFDVLNSYYRYSEKILEVSLNNTYTFKVVGINSTSFGEEFFISQQKANEITKLSQGLWKILPNGQTSHVTKNSPIYNGIFSLEQDPLLLSKTLSFYSLFGPYGNFAKFNLKDRGTNEILKWVVPQEMYSYIAPVSLELVEAYNSKHNLNLNGGELSWKISSEKFGTSKELFVKVVSQDWFSENVIPITLSSLENYQLEKELNNSLFLTLEILQILLLSILLPIIIFVILILTSQMMEEIKKIILIMKLLGYSNGHNLVNILFVFIPIFIFSILLGTLLVWISMISFQSFMYGTASIFVNSFINVTNLMYSFLTLLAIMVINFLFTLFIYRKTNLNLVLN